MLETQREPVPSTDASELETALAFLTFARGCVLKKLDGLGDEQLRRRFVVSETNLLGLVSHLTDGERYWFGFTLAGDQAFADVDFSMLVPEDRSAADVVAASIPRRHRVRADRVRRRAHARGHARAVAAARRSTCRSSTASRSSSASPAPT